MHWKKDLKIETKFFEDDIEGIPDAILVPPTQEFIRVETGPSDDHDFLARTGAEVIERLLSNRIIQNFLSCWQTLKQAALPPLAYRSHHRTSHSSLLSHNKPQQDQNKLIHHYDRILVNDDMHSSSIDWLQQQRQGFYFKTKIAETHVQKAKILKNIVEKLKRARKQTVNIDQNIIRLRSNHLLLSQIKQLEQVTTQLQMQRLNSFQKEKATKTETDYIRIPDTNNKPREQLKDLQKTLWNELSLLKEELRGLRLDNETLLERQVYKQAEIESIKKQKDQLFQRYDQLKEQHQQYINSKHTQKEVRQSNYHSQTPPPPSPPQIQTYQLQMNSSRQQEGRFESPKVEVDRQFKSKYQKQMSLLYQRIRNLEEREELMRSQLLKELQLREAYIKSNEVKQQQFRAQLIEAQKAKERMMKEQSQKEMALKESLKREQTLKQSFLQEHALKENELRQEIRREQEMRQQALRQQNQRELELREKNIRDITQRENQLRQKLLQEYKTREASIKQQENKLRKLQSQQEQFFNNFEMSLKEKNDLHNREIRKDAKSQESRNDTFQKNGFSLQSQFKSVTNPHAKIGMSQHSQFELQYQPDAKLEVNYDKPISKPQMNKHPQYEQLMYQQPKFESQVNQQSKSKINQQSRFVPQMSQQSRYQPQSFQQTEVSRQPQFQLQNRQEQLKKNETNQQFQQYRLQSQYGSQFAIGSVQAKTQYNPQVKTISYQQAQFGSQPRSNVRSEPKGNELPKQYQFQSEQRPSNYLNFMNQGNMSQRTQKIRAGQSFMDNSRYDQSYGYQTTTTVKKVTSTQQPAVFWHSSQGETITKKTFQQDGRKGESTRTLYQKGPIPDFINWEKEQEKSKYCGCCF